MGIGAIGNYGYNNYYQVGNKSGSGQSFAASMNTSTQINLKMTDEATGDKALTSVGFPDGGSASVYKADSYTEANPEYRVKYWDKDGTEKEYLINPKEVNPEKASYMEMLAYTTYSDVQGYTKAGLGHFFSAAGGLNQAKSYSLGNIDTKQNFKMLVEKMMNLQYDNNNLEGYMSYKQLYDYMGQEK